MCTRLKKKLSDLFKKMDVQLYLKAEEEEEAGRGGRVGFSTEHTLDSYFPIRVSTLHRAGKGPSPKSFSCLDAKQWLMHKVPKGANRNNYLMLICREEMKHSSFTHGPYDVSFFNNSLLCWQCACRCVHV